MRTYIINPQDTLQHHGIKGQKWGIRRFQNEDGTLTEAGKVRYNEDGSPKNVNKMTDKELQDANRRLQAESQYRQLTGTTQPGRSFNRDTAIKIGATFLGTGALTFLARKWKTGKFIGTKSVAVKGKKGFQSKKMIGAAIMTALLAGGIGALIAGTRSLGGEAVEKTRNEK